MGRFLRGLIGLVLGLLSFSTQAQNSVALLGEALHSPIYEAVSAQLPRVTQVTSELCDIQTNVVVFDWQDLQRLDEVCQPPRAIFSVGLNATDKLLKRPNLKGYFTSHPLSSQLVAAHQLIEGPLTVLYSEQAELQSIQAFQNQYPELEITMIPVTSSGQAVKSLGRSILKSSAVILGSNPDIFNETFLITARKMSLKFLTPLVGGSSPEFLKKGTALGVFVSNADGQQALEYWLRTGQVTQPAETLMLNQKMLNYFGLRASNE